MALFELFVQYIQPFLPDVLIRALLWVVLQLSMRQLASKDWPQKEIRFVKRSREMSNIAVDTGAANEQHYEMPTSFFLSHLGPRMKYSSCEYKGEKDQSLEAAEDRTLDTYIKHLKMDDGTVKRVLDIGCGWGSFSLYAAEKFPKIQFVCFSNSETQIAFIAARAKEKNLKNLKPVRVDINNLSLDALGETEVFDRAVSIECLEHSKNYEEIFARLKGMLNPKGRCFFQLLCHREYSYSMRNDSWMGRNFFTGGCIPSTNLFYYFNKNLVVEDQIVIPGTE
jgi:cyclopropane-fatty-acyl-phospholipid synthase